MLLRMRQTVTLVQDGVTSQSKTGYAALLGDLTYFTKRRWIGIRKRECWSFSHSCKWQLNNIFVLKDKDFEAKSEKKLLILKWVAWHEKSVNPNIKNCELSENSNPQLLQNRIGCKHWDVVVGWTDYLQPFMYAARWQPVKVTRPA